jgi:hypothetical protein
MSFSETSKYGKSPERSLSVLACRDFFSKTSVFLEIPEGLV